ncbi:MAG TPA: tetratricopeptide repeat protein [Candidatus Nitrosotalea sp.]|nr:tetratricopeptide repeat protein [Candidatus Nitrosotalea sp.]
MKLPSINRVKNAEGESVKEKKAEEPAPVEKPAAAEAPQTQPAPIKDSAARFEDNMRYIVKALTAIGMPMVLRSEQTVMLEDDVAREVLALLEENEALKSQISEPASISEGEEYLLKAANFFYFKGEPQKAISIYNQILEKNPTKMAALNNRGVVLDAAGEYEDALKSFNDALARVPENVHLLSNKGITLYKDEKYDQSLECFDAALKIDANYVNALTFKAHALYRLGRNPEALDLYNKIIRLDNNNAEALYNKACLCSLKGDQYGAVTSLERAVRIDPTWREAAEQDKDLDRVREALRLRNTAK